MAADRGWDDTAAVEEEHTPAPTLTTHPDDIFLMQDEADRVGQADARTEEQWTAFFRGQVAAPGRPGMIEAEAHSLHPDGNHPVCHVCEEPLQFPILRAGPWADHLDAWGTAYHVECFVARGMLPALPEDQENEEEEVEDLVEEDAAPEKEAEEEDQDFPGWRDDEEKDE